MLQKLTIGGFLQKLTIRGVFAKTYNLGVFASVVGIFHSLDFPLLEKLDKVQLS